MSLDDLAAMKQTTATLPIACVEGWSSSADWTGVPLRDLVAMVGATTTSQVTVGRCRVSAYASSVSRRRTPAIRTP